MTEEARQSLFASYASSRDQAVMAQLVEEYLPLSRAVARKFQGQGVELEDLQQVAALALVQAIERYEPSRGLKFSTFALPTIAGTVRNHLRDRGSTIRMGRSVRTQLSALRQATEALERELRRAPTMQELADKMAIAPDELLSLLEMRRTLDTTSLDVGVGEEEDAPRLEEFLGQTDAGYERVEQRQWMQWVYRQLSPQEQLLVHKRFEQRLGQRETAQALGVSQMQVSRMERRLLTRLRECMYA